MADQITPLPTPPSTSDPANFDARADAFLAALPTFQEELNEFGASLNSLSTTTSSVSSVGIGTGTKNFTVETGKSLFVGMSYRMAYDANNWMNGEVISYDSGTGALSLEVDAARGSGTYAAWVGTLSFNGQIETEQLANGIFNGLTTATLDPAADYVAIADGSDSGNKKKGLLPDASETAKGIVELATAAEYIAGTDPDRVPSVKTLRENNVVSLPAQSASGSSIPFGDIPSWVKHICVKLSSISSSGTNFIYVQLGDAGGVETSGYGGVVWQPSADAVLQTSGFNFVRAVTASSSYTGHIWLTRQDDTNNLWIASGIIANPAGPALTYFAGSKSLSDTLTQLRLSTADTFDAGTISVDYYG